MRAEAAWPETQVYNRIYCMQLTMPVWEHNALCHPAPIVHTECSFTPRYPYLKGGNKAGQGLVKRCPPPSKAALTMSIVESSRILRVKWMDSIEMGQARLGFGG